MRCWSHTNLFHDHAAPSQAPMFVDAGGSFLGTEADPKGKLLCGQTRTNSRLWKRLEETQR